MYGINYCWEDSHRMVAVFRSKEDAEEYATIKRRMFHMSDSFGAPICIEVLDGDTQILRLFTKPLN